MSETPAEHWSLFAHGNLVAWFATEREAIEYVIDWWQENDCNWDGFDAVFVWGSDATGEFIGGWDPDNGYLEP